MTDLYDVDAPEDLLPGTEDPLPPEADSAPWGINPRTNKPYTKSPEERAEIGARLAAGRRAAAAGGGRRGGKVKAPRRTRAAGPSAAASTAAAPSHHEILTGVLVQLPSFVCELLGRFSPAFQLDSVTFVLHGPALVDAVAMTAQADQRVAAWVEKLGEITPWTMLLAAALPLGLQLAANHKAVAPNPDLGIFSAEQLMAELERRHGAAA